MEGLNHIVQSFDLRDMGTAKLQPIENRLHLEREERPDDFGAEHRPAIEIALSREATLCVNDHE